MNLFKDVEGKALPEQLRWFNEPVQWAFRGGELFVQAEPSTNLFNDPDKSSRENTAHYLYTTANGDFSFTARVEVDMLSMFDAACLLVKVDEDRWAKLCYENWLNEPSIVSVVTRQLSDDCPSLRIGRVKPYLRILRSGDCFGFFFSLDAQDWTVIRYFTMDVPREVKVGVVAQSPVGTGCPVHVEFFEFELKEIKTAKYVEKD